MHLIKLDLAEKAGGSVATHSAGDLIGSCPASLKYYSTVSTAWKERAKPGDPSH